MGWPRRRRDSGQPVMSGGSTSRRAVGEDREVCIEERDSRVGRI